MSNFDLTGVLAFCLVAVSLSLVLKGTRPEFSMAVSVLAVCGIILYVVMALSCVKDSIYSAVSGFNIDGGLLKTMFKCAGICVISETVGECCRDAGESAIASKAEFAGKAALMVVSLPAAVRFFKIIADILN